MGKPVFMALRKKIRAKLCAMMHDIPHALMANGACSLEEPHPKLAAATMTSPGLTLVGNPGSIPSMQYLASSLGSETFK